jgi:hypothetical protein
MAVVQYSTDDGLTWDLVAPRILDPGTDHYDWMVCA